MGWMIGAIAVLFVTNATAIWKWHQARTLSKMLVVSLDGHEDAAARQAMRDHFLRLNVGMVRKLDETDEQRPVHLLAIDLIYDMHKQVRALMDLEGGVAAGYEDPDYGDYAEMIREETEHAAELEALRENDAETKADVLTWMNDDMTT